MPVNDKEANDHKNPGFTPRMQHEGKQSWIQPASVAANDALKQHIQSLVPLTTMPNADTPTHALINPKTGAIVAKNPDIYPDFDTPAAVMAAIQGQSPIPLPIVDPPQPIMSAEPPKERGKFAKKGKKPEPPQITSSQATGMVGQPQEVTQVHPDAPVNSIGQVISAMPGQPPAILPPTPALQAEPQPTPPKTRQEYLALQQQMAGNFNYPDIADVFSGKIPGIVPLNQQVIPKVMPVQRVVTEVTVNHETPNKARAYQAIEQFTAWMDGTSLTFMRGEPIYDVNIIDFLLMTKCQKIAPMSEVENWLQCPHCHQSGPPEAFGDSPGMVQPGTTDYQAFARGIGLQPRQRTIR